MLGVKGLNSYKFPLNSRPRPDKCKLLKIMDNLYLQHSKFKGKKCLKGEKYILKKNTEKLNCNKVTVVKDDKGNSIIITLFNKYERKIKNLSPLINCKN